MHDPENSEAHPLRRCLSVIVLLIYQIFGIVYLVNNYNLGSTCIDTHLWIYVLISLISTLSHCGAAENLSKETAIAPCCLGLLNVGLGIWGNWEVMGASCLAMHNNHLWKFGFATFILQYIAGGLYLLISSCYICLICREDYSYRGGYYEV